MIIEIITYPAAEPRLGCPFMMSPGYGGQIAPPYASGSEKMEVSCKT